MDAFVQAQNGPDARVHWAEKRSACQESELRVPPFDPAVSTARFVLRPSLRR